MAKGNKKPSKSRNHKSSFSRIPQTSQVSRNRSVTPQSKQRFPETEVQPVANNAPKGPLATKNQCVGILRQAGFDGYIEPDAGYDMSQYGRIAIRSRDLNGAPFDMKVVCEISNPNAVPGSYEGKIIEVLGDPGNTDVAMLGLIRQFGLSTSFPEAVLAESMQYPVNPSEEDLLTEIQRGRRDLRTLRTITIDGEDAKDLDDAISIERIPAKGYRLYVHIADVSHYVKDQSELDVEARQRGTSVYLSDRVIPMLPPRLSNGLCSLNPHVARLALTAEIMVGYDGQKIDGEIYESIIQSDMRASYKGVYAALYEKKSMEDYDRILPMLETMRELKEILTSARKRRGSINFDLPETRVELDQEGKPLSVYAYPINEANGIIEEFMIMCNEFVASQFDKMKYPFVYRVHEEPDSLKIREFLHVAKMFGARTVKGKHDSAMLQALMEDISGKEYEPALSQLLLRSLAKAKYSPMNLGHFGLASQGYCHFTSPIRRYPDLYIHRIIKNYLNGHAKKNYFATQVESVSLHSSEMERNAMEAERASVSQKIAEYMTRHIGDTFDGIISGVSRGGIFVRLPSTIEGMVPFRIMDDYFTFDERRLEARGSSSGRVFRIGANVKVTVTGADIILRRVDFALANEQGTINSSAGKKQIARKTEPRKKSGNEPSRISHKSRKNKK